MLRGGGVAGLVGVDGDVLGAAVDPGEVGGLGRRRLLPGGAMSRHSSTPASSRNLRLFALVSSIAFTS